MKIRRLKIKACLFLSAITLLGSCTTAPPSTTEIQNSSQSPATTISIGGSSETYSALELLTDAYKAENKGIEFKFLPPSQSSGAIEGVKQNTIDVGGVSRTIAADESGAQLQYLPLVETPLVVVVHNSVTNVTNLSADQLRAIYKGDLNNWQQLGGPDAAIVLLDFTEEENEKQVLRQAYLGDDTVGNTPFSVAVLPVEDELEDLPVKVLSIDGVAPSADTLQAGTYKMKLPMGIVLPKAPEPEVQAFIEFVTGTQGTQVLSTAGLRPVQPSQK
jgi:phosphate transport system substrate-binding protein